MDDQSENHIDTIHFVSNITFDILKVQIQVNTQSLPMILILVCSDNQRQSLTNLFDY